MTRSRARVGLLLGLLWPFGCSRTLRVQLPPGEEALVIARFERQLPAGTETRRSLAGYAAALTEPSGDCALAIPRGGGLGRLMATVTASRPGYAITEREPVEVAGFGWPSDATVELELTPSDGFRAEQSAIWRLEQLSAGLEAHLEPEPTAQVARHVSARQARLRATWPEELARFEQRRDQRTLTPLPLGPGALASDEAHPPQVLDAIEAPGGGWLVAHTTAEGRALSLLGPAGEQPTGPPLQDRGIWAAMAHDPAGKLWIYDRGALLSADSGEPRALRLQMDGDEHVTALTWTHDGPLLAVQRGDATVDLRQYTPAGALITSAQPTGVRSITRLLAGVDGEILAVASLEGGFDDSLKVSGLKKRDAMPRGLVRVDLTGQVQPLLLGVDSAVWSKGEILAYAADLYAPEDEVAVQQGFTAGLVRQVLFRLKPDGELLSTCDVSDADLGATPAALAQPLSGAVALYPTTPATSPLLSLRAEARACLDSQARAP